jgi:hypothetical protein
MRVEPKNIVASDNAITNEKFFFIFPPQDAFPCLFVTRQYNRKPFREVFEYACVFLSHP